MKNDQNEKKHLSSDLLAGLTFALVSIPQAFAYPLLAAVNPGFILCTYILATPVGALFTSATFMNVTTNTANTQFLIDRVVKFFIQRDR